MGSILSRRAKPKIVNQPDAQAKTENKKKEETKVSKTEEEEDEEALEKIKRELNTKFDLFLLNQLVMSVMFFEDFDREVTWHPKRKDHMLNQELLYKFNKSCLKPDVLAEVVNKYVKFKQPMKDTFESLLPRRIFIISNDIDVEEENAEEDDYDDIESFTYRTKRRKSAKHKGFINLVIPEEKSHPEALPSYSSKEQSESSDSNDDENIEDIVYDEINEARTLKPLIGEPSYAPLLPKYFIARVQEHVREKDKVVTKMTCLLNSQALMQHFKNNFKPQLSHPLGFNAEDLKTAKETKTSIFCSVNEDGVLVSCELIPAVTIQFAAYEAYEWINGTSRRELRSLRGKMYKWPSEKMVSEIKTLQCVAIPRGYMSKNEKNDNFHLEWEVGFPNAEKYLEITMAHAHMRVYLILVALFKTYIEPYTHKMGLLVEHLKNFIFWQIEKHPLDWPENNLGTKLTRVIETFNDDHLSKKVLWDYFVREKNLFENIPSAHLITAQKQFHKVLHNHFVHVLYALKNLDYTSDFYTMPDFKEMYDIATTEDMKHITATNSRKSLTKSNGKKEEKEQLNFRWKLSTCDDAIRRSNVLIYFIKHYMKIAEESYNKKAHTQGILYMKQCSYLVEILRTYMKTEHERDVAAQAKEDMKQLGVKIMYQQSTQPPPTPTRNSVLHVVPESAIVINNNALNIQNLQQSYMQLSTQSKRQKTASVQLPEEAQIKERRAKTVTFGANEITEIESET